MSLPMCAEDDGLDSAVRAGACCRTVTTFSPPRLRGPAGVGRRGNSHEKVYIARAPTRSNDAPKGCASGRIRWTQR